MNKSVPLWVKVLASELSSQDIVDNVKIGSSILKVRYTTGLTERYYIEIMPLTTYPLNYIIDRSCVRIKNDIKDIKQFRADMLDPEDVQNASKHKVIRLSHYHKLTIIERRLVVHRIIKQLIDNQIQISQFPKDALTEDWAAVLRAKATRNYTHNNMVCLHPGYGSSEVVPGWRILLHYFGIDEGNLAWTLLRVISKLVNKELRDITVTRILRKCCKLIGVTNIDPIGYATLLSKLSATDTVLDLYPDTGQKALACALLGIKYYTPKTDKMEHAISAGLSDTIGLVHEWYDSQPVDLILSDNDFKSFDISRAKRYLKYAKRLMAYAPGGDRQKIRESAQPANFVPFYKCTLHKYISNQDFIAIW